MINIILGLACIILCFSTEVLIEKKFKKEGLIVWVAISMITANILVAKSIDILCFKVTLGNILFASTFLATDIMVEKYSVEDSKKAIKLGIISVLLFTIATQIALMFKENDLDLVQNSLKTIFDFNLRINVSSILMCLLSNLINIRLFDKLKKKYPNKLFLRNNLSTIICNCLENFAFTFLAFSFVYDFRSLISISISTCMIETIIALLDTPFLYLSKYKR